MSTTAAPSTPASSARSLQPKRILPAHITRPALHGLAAFIILAAAGLGIALAIGATLVFNVLVWLLFAVLWLAVLAALAFSPATVDELWRSWRQRPLVVQALIWLLFLPIMLGLWIWTRAWAPPIRLLLLLSIAVWNLLLFFPHG